MRQVATVAWAVTFRVSSATSYLSLVFHAVVVEWLGFGVLCATLCWWTANHYLRLRAKCVAPIDRLIGTSVSLISRPLLTCASLHLCAWSSQGIGDTFFVEQRVEWQFAFDIHCNAFFILFLFLYVLQVRCP